MPYIITVKNPSKKNIDNSLVKDIPPDIKVYKTASFEFREKQRSILLNAIKKLVKKYILIPDDKIGWLFFAINASKKIIKFDNINIICTTSPPHSTHLIGLLLKKKYNCKWIADFRDPWTQSFMKKSFYKKNKKRHAIESLLEKKVISQADRVIVVSDTQKELLKEKFDVNSDKIVVINNGYDEEDFPKQIDSPVKRNSEFIITHVGRIYPGNSKNFFIGVKKLIDENEIFKKKVKIKLVGIKSLEALAYIEKYHLSKYVIQKGFLVHKESINEMINSDLLLLMTGDKKFWIPGKLYEYIRAKKPILVIGDRGDAAKIALKSGLGVFVSHMDISGIKSSINDCFERKEKGIILEADSQYIQLFNRENLSKKFAEVLNQI